MKHLCIVEQGSFLGVNGKRLVVRSNKEVVAEYPLSRLKSVVIAKSGVSFSSNLLEACAGRGIKFFINDFKGRPCVCLSGVCTHAVSEVRKKQFTFIDSDHAPFLAMNLIKGKIKNQKAVLNYFAKYQQKTSPQNADLLKEASVDIVNAVNKLKPAFVEAGNWRNKILGIEGWAAARYFQALSVAELLPPAFFQRQKRGADDVVNSAFNYGYAILSSRIWSAIINAGLEPYAGVLHVERPGKPSLVLDLMEEYRAWTVDRIVIKKRSLLSGLDELNPKVKKEIIIGVQETFSKKYYYGGKRLSLDSILQRQVYKLAGCFAGNKNYKPYIFKW
jgi:CRISP-associated protein Cas1